MKLYIYIFKFSQFQSRWPSTFAISYFNPERETPIWVYFSYDEFFGHQSGIRNLQTRYKTAFWTVLGNFFYFLNMFEKGSWMENPCACKNIY